MGIGFVSHNRGTACRARTGIGLVLRDRVWFVCAESPPAMVIERIPHRLYYSYWDKTYYYSSFFLVLFLSVRIVSCVICFTPGVVSGPQVPALRGLSRDRPSHTCSGGFKG